MIEFRDWYTAEIGAKLIVHTNAAAIADGAHPFALGTQRCCGLLKTQALLDGIAAGGFDAAFGGAGATRSDRAPRSACSRSATTRASGIRNASVPSCGTSSTAGSRRVRAIRVFPLSNWTELDVWQYIDVEKIPVVPLYFAKPREVIVRGGAPDHAGAAVRPAAAG